MKTEALFITPSEAIARINFPKGKAPDPEFFRGLLEFQYDFDQPILDRSMAAILKEQYWKQIAPNYLLVVKNHLNDRFGQVGSILGVVMGDIAGMFGDTVIEKFVEDELLLLEKRRISPEAAIAAQYLDDRWENVAETGQLVGYRANPPDKRPFGLFVVKVENKQKTIEDWGMFSGSNVRFVVTETSLLA